MLFRHYCFFLMIFICASLIQANGQSYVSTIPPANVTIDGLQSISSVTIDNEGSVFLADSRVPAIYIFDSDGELTDTILEITGPAGTVESWRPVALTFDHNGLLYVADDRNNKIYVLEDKQFILQIGESGRAPGQYRNIKDIAIDRDNYLYVLDDRNNRVDIYDSDGIFLNWVSGPTQGPTRAFNNPVSIGVDGNNNLYVMETRDAKVHIFNETGNHTKTLDQLVSGANILDRVSSMIVFKNGDFIVLDERTGTLMVFDSDGNLIQRVGRQGRQASPGIFRDATKLSHGVLEQNTFFIIDSGANNVQRYKYNFEDPELAASEKIKVQWLDKNIPAFSDAVFAPNGNFYYIPAGNQRNVVALDGETGRELFRIPGEDIHRIATDDNSRIYVLDRHRRVREVQVFNSEGHFQFSVGQDVDTPLQSPDDLAILSNGSIIVSDRRQGAFYKWSSNGIFQGFDLRISHIELNHIRFIRTDSHDNIYILDPSMGIFRISPDGILNDYQPLSVFREDPARGRADVLWFDIDKSDLIHLFNEDTNQYMVFRWESSEERIQYPELLFRFGRDGTGVRRFSRPENVVLNPYRLETYVNSSRAEMVAFQLIIRPPRPDLDQVIFSVENSRLMLKPQAYSQGSVTGFAIGIKNQATGDINVVSESNDMTVSVFNPAQGTQPIEYVLLAKGSGSLSEPSAPFVDYIGLGNHFGEIGQYQRAYEAYLLALDYYNRDKDFDRHFAKQFIEWGKILANRRQTRLTTLMMATAAELIEPTDVLAREVSEVLTTLFRTIARTGNYSELIQNLDNLLVIKNEQIKDDVTRELDRISRDMAGSNLEERIAQAVTIWDKLVTWTNRSNRTLAGSSYGQFRLYRALNSAGAPYMTLNLRLSQALNTINEAIEKATLKNEEFNRNRLLQLDILMEMMEFERVRDIAEMELSTQVPGLDQEFVGQYRIVSGKAMIAMEQYNSAVFNYTELLRLNPNNPKYQELLAYAYYRDGRHREALSTYQQLHTEYPDEPRFLAMMGRAEYAQGNYPQATFLLEQATNMPDAAEFYGFFALAYYADRKYQEAVRHFQTTINELNRRYDNARSRMAPQPILNSIVSELEVYLFQFGRTNMRLRNYSQAAETLSRLTEIVHNNATYWYELGNAYTNAGLVYNAEEAFFRATSIDTANDLYIRAYNNAKEQSASYAANQPPVRVLRVNINPVFPSLFLNYAETQSIGEAIIENNTESVIANASLEVTFQRFSGGTFYIDLPVLTPRSNTSVALYYSFGENILQNANDLNVQATVRVVYSYQGESRTNSANANVVMHRRSAIDWSDKRRLTAFISPGNNQIRSFVSEINAAMLPLTVDGIPDPITAAARIYTALNSSGFVYQRDPNMSNILQAGILDDIQFPAETLMLRSGECDDFVTLLSNLLESQGINTAYIDVPGHVFLALDTGLEPHHIEQMGFDPNLLISRGGKVWLPIETTLLGRADFIEAWRSGASRWYQELEEGNLPQLVEMESARRIYVPSEFIPDNFRVSLPAENLLNRHYEAILGSLYQLVNDGQIRALRNRIEAEPGNITLINRFGVMLARAGNTDEALRVLKNALEFNENSGPLNNNIGNIYFLKGSYSNAIDYYEKSVSGDAPRARFWVNLAKAYNRTGDNNAARRAFNEAVELDGEIRDLYDFLYERIRL